MATPRLRVRFRRDYYKRPSRSALPRALMSQAVHCYVPIFIPPRCVDAVHTLCTATCLDVAGGALLCAHIYTASVCRCSPHPLHCQVHANFYRYSWCCTAMCPICGCYAIKHAPSFTLICDMLCWVTHCYVPGSCALPCAQLCAPYAAAIL